MRCLFWTVIPRSTNSKTLAAISLFQPISIARPIMILHGSVMFLLPWNDGAGNGAIRTSFAMITGGLELRMFFRGLTALIAVELCLFQLAARADLWCTAYYPGWEQGVMPASSIDFTAVTHIIHFSLMPNSDGTLNSSVNSITSPNSSDIVSHAHAAGKRVL